MYHHLNHKNSIEITSFCSYIHTYIHESVSNREKRPRIYLPMSINTPLFFQNICLRYICWWCDDPIQVLPLHWKFKSFILTPLFLELLIVIIYSITSGFITLLNFTFLLTFIIIPFISSKTYISVNHYM